jgi:hypothetical protein
MKRCYLVLLVMLVIGMSATTNVMAAAVTNGDFETLYKPGTGITGVVSPGGWSQGVGPNCEKDNGNYVFDDATTGDFADIPGWVGYDRDGWIAFGGTYGRDQTTGNYQGSISTQHNHTDGGSMCYLSNGGGWGNPAGGLIISDPVTRPSAGPFVLSMWAKGGANPPVLALLVDGVIRKPNSAVSPALIGNTWQEFTRTYDSLPDGVLTIVLGVDRPLSPDVPGATGSQTRFDDVTFIPEPATIALLGLGGLALLRRKRR